MKFADANRIDRGRPTFVDALGLGGFDSPHLARADEVFFHHPDHAQHREHDLPHDVAAVHDDVGIVNAQNGLLLDNPLGNREEIGGISCPPVGMQGDRFVTGLQNADQRFQLIAAMKGGAVPDIGEDDDGPLRSPTWRLCDSGRPV